MSVKSSIAAITPTAADVTQAEKLGVDLTGCLYNLQLKCDEIVDLLNFLNTDVFTPAGDTTNAATLTAQVTAVG
jgi:hypothetical protein